MGSLERPPSSRLLREGRAEAFSDLPQVQPLGHCLLQEAPSPAGEPLLCSLMAHGAQVKLQPPHLSSLGPQSQSPVNIFLLHGTPVTTHSQGIWWVPRVQARVLVLGIWLCSQPSGPWPHAALQGDTPVPAVLGLPPRMP